MSSDQTKLFSLLQGLDSTPIESRKEFQKGPFLWPGNKYNSLENILKLLPYKRGFVEVFGGSGVVTLNRKPSLFEVFNDRNSGVVAFFKVLREQTRLNELIDILELMPHAREEFFNSVTTWEQETDDVMKAAKFYASVQASFRGEQRVFGRMIRGRTDLWRKIRERFHLFDLVHSRFREIQVENLDWRVCLKDFDDKDGDVVFYLDPPYISKNHYQHKMSIENHREMCHIIMGMKNFVALSGYENSVYDEFEWDHVYSWEIKDDGSDNRFNTDGSETIKTKRGFAKEFLWIKE